MSTAPLPTLADAKGVCLAALAAIIVARPRGQEVSAAELGLSADRMAGFLDGRPIGQELTPEERRVAYVAGLTVVMGHSQGAFPAVRLSGDINAEVNAPEARTTLFLHRGGVLPEHDQRRCRCYFCRYDDAVYHCVRLEARRGLDDVFEWTWDYPADRLESVGRFVLASPDQSAHSTGLVIPSRAGLRYLPEGLGPRTPLG